MEKAMAPHSCTLAWKIPWPEKPGRLQSMGSQRVGHDWATSRSLLFSALISWDLQIIMKPNLYCHLIALNHWPSQHFTVSFMYISCCYSVTKSCPTLCNPMHCSTSGLPDLHHLLEFVQIHAHSVTDAIQPSHPVVPLSPPAFSLSQHQSLFQWVGSSHQVAWVLEFQLQRQSF